MFLLVSMFSFLQRTFTPILLKSRLSPREFHGYVYSSLPRKNEQSACLFNKIDNYTRRRYTENVSGSGSIADEFCHRNPLRVWYYCTSIQRIHLCTSMRTNVQTNRLKGTSGINLLRILLLFSYQAVKPT